MGSGSGISLTVYSCDDTSRIAFVQDKDSLFSLKEKVKSALDLLGGIDKFVKPGNRVLLKPNFVAPFPRATTNFDVIKIMVEQVRDCNAEAIIAESSGYEFDTEMTFKSLGVYDLAKELNVDVVNLDRHPFRVITIENGCFKKYIISEITFNVDVIINLPRFKKHSQTDVTIGIKNLFGFLDHSTRRKIHAFNLDGGIALLSKIVKSNLTIVDTSTLLDRAVFGEEKKLGGVVAGEDILAVDRFCCHLAGIDPDCVAHIKIASQEGLGNTKYDVLGSQPKTIDELSQPERNLKITIHRLGYKSMYALDMALSRLFGIKTLISYFHYYLGIRPVIRKKNCDACGECVKVCTIDAIDLRTKSIKKNCRHLRCMKCVEACPLSAIIVRGRKDNQKTMDIKA